MTSSTDELRRLLDERGVEYQVRNDYVTYVYFDDRAITFFSDVVDGEMASVGVAVDFPKPVLNGTVWLTPEQAVVAALGRSTLTAEQVENAVYHHCKFYEGGDVDAQAIADELNATLGRGTCHDVWQDDVHANFKCSECGETLNVYDKKRVACCPFCKREVVSA